MDNRTCPIRDQGFSLVEMLVALVFTMILMAGMATVFKSSLTTFYTSGESISSSRRNRMSIDLLYDDLNSACMALANISSWDDSQFSAANPAFYILPNQAINLPALDGPQTADELYMFFDQPMPFEGLLKSGGGADGVGIVAAKAVTDQVAMNAGATPDNRYLIECDDVVYAHMVKPGMQFHIKDDMSNAALTINAVTVPGGATGTTVLVDTSVAPSLKAAVTGRGDPGTLRSFQRIKDSRVAFFLPAQMIRYRIQMRNLDPANPVGIPCLVRDQANYDAGGFPAAPANFTTDIVTENVAGFTAYLSANSGTSWVGGTDPATGVIKSGYTWAAIRGDLDTQLSTSGRAGFKTTQGNEHWFRDIPALVRLDITTRTATKRGEYSTTVGTTDYKRLTQSLVLVPRHFGLTMK